MNELLESQQLIVSMAIALLVLAFAYYALRRNAARVEVRRRIEAARLRSGHVPLEVPTTRGFISREGPDTLPEWFTEGDDALATVDETPRMRLRYLDAHGKKAQGVLQVERLDLERKLIVGHTDTPGDVRRIFLHQVLSARSAETGQRFNLDTWVEAVRVARRRRGLAR
ncbi:hypothetical protein [Variovorax sp. GT1P44]|uniref:hypothetical protein n=1 Tax=Variovorax sp. GT1P44 TaxID=3443742 RepID=UPI003F464B10